MSGSAESNPIVNLVIGLIIGVGASFLYIRFGIEMPSAIGVGQRITSQAIVKTAEFELYNTRNPPLVRHRALAVILANRPEEFLAVDQAIGHRFLNEFLRQNQSGVPLNGPVVVNQPAGKTITVNRALVGTKVIGSSTILAAPTIGVGNKSHVIARAILQQKYPDATNETIEFLIAHPEIRPAPIRIGRQATLPGMLNFPSKENSNRR